MNFNWKSTDDVRETFLNYFLRNDHQLIQPSGIVPKEDSTLILINSGMAPLKPFFTGKKTAPYPRMTNVQDCVRFNDIESVGDSYHGTSFRMMGSWSFGDYFKERAIELAFTLITDVFGLPRERLLATVFVSDERMPNVPSDEESIRIWERYLPRERIIGKPAQDNFWGPAGTSGPCGPCTEVFFDRGEKFAEGTSTDQLVPGQHVEIWNAGVFMQYFKDENGKFSPLPMKCVDTGAGLERFSMILQNASSIHEIDQYAQVYKLIDASISDAVWSRTILDHFKTSILMMRENIIPSNQREGYLLRRALRRAMTGMFLHDIELSKSLEWINTLIETIDNPELSRMKGQTIESCVHAETASFEKLIYHNQKHLNKIISRGSIDANEAFVLKATLGIPEDLIEGFCKQHNINFPKEKFFKLIQDHQKISRR